MPAYPFWSLTLDSIDMLVIYGLAPKGGTPEQHGNPPHTARAPAPGLAGAPRLR
jgi:hypothetical protein